MGLRGLYIPIATGVLLWLLKLVSPKKTVRLILANIIFSGHPPPSKKNLSSTALLIFTTPGHLSHKFHTAPYLESTELKVYFQPSEPKSARDALHNNGISMKRSCQPSWTLGFSAISAICPGDLPCSTDFTKPRVSPLKMCWKISAKFPLASPDISLPGKGWVASNRTVCSHI